jgi:hypothetical protein
MGTNFDFFITYGLNSYKTMSVWFDNYDENWFISPDLLLKTEYSYKKLRFRGRFSLPLFAVGNFRNQFHSPAYSTAKDYFFKTKIIPNHFLLPNNIFYPNISLSALFPVGSNLDLKLKYSFESLDLNFNFLEEKKEQHDLRIGLVWKIK